MLTHILSPFVKFVFDYNGIYIFLQDSEGAHVANNYVPF
jgi:hypothetical protein